MIALIHYFLRDCKLLFTSTFHETNYSVKQGLRLLETDQSRYYTVRQLKYCLLQHNPPPETFTKI